jgi:hypothetical protein
MSASSPDRARRSPELSLGVAALVLAIAASLAAALAPPVHGASTAAAAPGTTDGPFVYQYPAPISAGPDAGSRFAVIPFGTPRKPTDPVLKGSTPAWSPSGLQFAFARGALGHRQIFLADADGTNVTGPVTRQTTEAKDPTWSPDGSTLAFSGTLNGDRQIWSVTVQGTDEHPLTNDPYGAIQPAWSPSSTTPEIAFSSLRAGGALWLMGTDGTGAHPVAGAPQGAGNAVWRDDTTLAFGAGPDTGRSIYTIARDGSHLRQLTFGAADGFPSFSPAGDAIAFTRTRALVPSVYVLALTPDGLAKGAPSQVIPNATHAHWGALPVPGDLAQIPRTMAAVLPPDTGGLVRLSAPNAARVVVLGAAGARIPVNYTVHAPDGVRLAANVAASSARPQTSVAAGVVATGTFRLARPEAPDTLTLDLPSVGGCPAGQSGASVAKKQSSSKQSVKVEHPRGTGGRVGVNTHDVNASSDHTIWTTEETCAGTRIGVSEGSVTVRVLGLGTTVRVSAPQMKFFARRLP